MELASKMKIFSTKLPTPNLEISDFETQTSNFSFFQQYHPQHLEKTSLNSLASKLLQHLEKYFTQLKNFSLTQHSLSASAL